MLPLRLLHGLARHRRSCVALALAGVGLSLIGAAPFAPPILIWNASASAPVGLYLRVGGEAGRDDYVLAHTPNAARDLAARRGYLPANVPMVKRVAAATGDLVCAADRTISINARIAAQRLRHDREHRALPWWSGCQRLTKDSVFLLMARVPDSFDGRYFGPVSRASIIGKLVPLWLE
jgi:conjugative transfer signal peptidase TraF